MHFSFYGDKQKSMHVNELWSEQKNGFSKIKVT